MTQLLAHRGRDGDGVRVFPASDRPPAALGHPRLAIIDPGPGGAQPMAYRDGSTRALRSGLERDGFVFTTDCDTEVLVALYARVRADNTIRAPGAAAVVS